MTSNDLTRPLDRVEQLDALRAIAAGNDDPGAAFQGLAEVLDHVCVRLDLIASMLERVGPLIEAGEQLAVEVGSNPMGLLGALMR